MTYNRRTGGLQEVIASRTSELADSASYLHPLARRLGKLMTDPRISGDLFQTMYSVRAAVNQVCPPKQVMNDARFLLAWFRQAVAVPVVNLSPPQPEHPPAIDAAILTHAMASQYGAPEDAMVIAAVLRSQQLLQ